MSDTFDQHEPHPVESRTDLGEASFTRLGPTEAVLNVAYRIPTREVPVGDANVRDAVTRLCEGEIATMRATLGTLGEELAAQLDDAGTAPEVTRTWRHQDSRKWANRGDEFRVAGTRTRVLDRIHTSEDVSEAKLVREHVRLMIAQREENIRDVYRQVLHDVSQGGQPEEPAAG